MVHPLTLDLTQQGRGDWYSSLPSGPFGPEDRPMGGHAALPEPWTARKAGSWIDIALAAAAALPPKAPKKQPAKKPATKKAAR